MTMTTLRPAQVLEKMPNSALILLNKAPADPNRTIQLAQATTKTVLLDGAANLFAGKLIEQGLAIDSVLGDGDSITSSTLEFLKQHGIPFHHDSDAYSTDLLKGLRYIKQHWPSIRTVCAYSAPGGRADHAWSTYLCTHIAHTMDLDLYLINEDSIVMYIAPGTTRVETPLSLVGDTAGFMPLMGSSRITIEGFKWDVEDWETSLTSVLSTSNVLVRDFIMVSTDKPLLFTVEIKAK